MQSQNNSPQFVPLEFNVELEQVVQISAWFDDSLTVLNLYDKRKVNLAQL